MAFLGAYLTRMRQIRAMHMATAETSYYNALENLLQDIGTTLTPRVTVTAQLSSKGTAIDPRGAELRGQPDFGFFVLETQDLRGLVEAKAPHEDVEEIARRPQIAKYLRAVPAILVTTYRAFLFITRGEGGAPQLGPAYMLAATVDDFWETPIAELVAMHEQPFRVYLETILQYAGPIVSPDELALILARYAADARLRIERLPPRDLDPLRIAMTQSLGIRFPGPQGESFFRSSLVQTLFYGLFSAWTIWAEGEPAETELFLWEEASGYLKVAVIGALFEAVATNRRLRTLNLADPVRWAEHALNRVQRSIFFTTFSKESAIQYFYEPFLEAYDPVLREQLGVWYTPPGIVRYQIQRIDQLLQAAFGITDGLADESVVILDPCTGTASYLLEAARLIHERLFARDPGLAAALTTKAITTRLLGFEIMPAPFVIAHLQMSRLAHVLGSGLVNGQRAAIYLTNALLSWAPVDTPEQTSFPELAEERQAADRVKREARILVVVGNPPYYRNAPISVGEEAQLLAPYKKSLYARFGVRKTTLDDLYIRFYRLAEWRIAEQAPHRGIVSYISNNSWLTRSSFPVMREHLLQSFSTVCIDNLGGGYRGRDRRVRDADESVFSTLTNPGISLNVAISFLLVDGKPKPQTTAAVTYRRLHGTADMKRSTLLTSLQDANVSPYVTLHPSMERKWVLRPVGESGDYDGWIDINRLFPYRESAVNENRGGSLIGLDPQELAALCTAYMDPHLSDQEFLTHSTRAKLLMGSYAGYDAGKVRSLLRSGQVAELPRVVRYAYRAFDDRWLIWGGEKLLNRKRGNLLAQVDPEDVPPAQRNLFLILCENARVVADPPGVTSYLTDLHYVDPWAQCFPLQHRVPAIGAIQMQRGRRRVRVSSASPQQTLDLSAAHTRPNLEAAILSRLSDVWGIRPTPSQEPASPEELALGESIFYHVLATLHTPAYREAHEEALASNWARVPIPRERDLLLESAALGRRVAALLRTDLQPFGVIQGSIPEWVRLLGSSRRIDGAPLRDPNDFFVRVNYRGAGRLHERPFTQAEARANADGAVDLGSSTYDIYWDEHAYWANVPSAVWRWQLGGFPVLRKWLDDRWFTRLQRPLHVAEIQEFSQITRRIAALLHVGDDLNACHEAVISSDLLTP